MEREEIRLIIERINNAWLKGPPEQIPAALAGCFDDGIVVRGPGFQLLGAGKQMLIQSYIDFVRQVAIQDCVLAAPEIDVVGDIAVANCPWQMTYELNGQEFREAGHDLFVFERKEGRWLAVWRALLPAAGR